MIFIVPSNFEPIPIYHASPFTTQSLFTTHMASRERSLANESELACSSCDEQRMARRLGRAKFNGTVGVYSLPKRPEREVSVTGDVLEPPCSNDASLIAKPSPS